jgi:MoaA/NifB/PqqE/SkfB family radical SAM enzyme
MIGLPGETRRDINGTLARAIELHERTGAWPSVQYATPLPGTRLAAMAQGTRLPVVRDWGPRFQHAPSIETDAFTRQDLEDFAWTFRQRLEAGQGAKKGILNPTYKCNNRCVFCVVSSQPQIGVNIDRQKEFLLGCRRDGVSVLGIDGGEPTLDPNLLSLVRFARRVGFEKVSVTTNGRMCAYPDYARRLVASGVTSVLFSIHGSNAQMHAASVGVLEAFEQTTDGVKNCVRLAPDGVELGANITLTKTNFEHLGSVVRLVSDLGLSRINVQFLTPFGRATNAVAPDTARAAEITMRVIDDWKDRMRIQVFNLPFCYTPGYERYLVGDPLDLERRMISVDGDEVNLLEYLREQRHYEERCHDCSRKVFCGGFYRMDDVPEPRWLLTPEDRERPLHQEGLRPLTGNDARRGLPVV